MRIAIGSDHRGAGVATAIAARLTDAGHEIIHLGGCSTEPCDYPEPAYRVGRCISGGQADRGVLVCGTGIGMSIAANKVAGVRAALAFDEMTARLSRSHNDANVLCLSADLLGSKVIERIVDIFFTEGFDGGRHARRVQKIHAIESGEDPAESASLGAEDHDRTAC